jgi:hypothetical protein
MNRLLLLLVLLLWLPLPRNSQGVFYLSTRTARTRLGSTNGPLAGPGIWGQAMAGFTVDTLTPVGVPAQHITNGLVFNQEISVPFADAYRTVLVQMAAWDGRVWGTSFAGVPPNQLGFTDIVPVYLVTPLGLQDFPQFSSPAVVPLVPEPSATTLAMLGGAALLVHLRRRRRPTRLPSDSS